jgi:hypothetical protein
MIQRLEVQVRRVEIADSQFSGGKDRSPGSACFMYFSGTDVGSDPDRFLKITGKSRAYPDTPILQFLSVQTACSVLEWPS